MSEWFKVKSKEDVEVSEDGTTLDVLYNTNNSGNQYVEIPLEFIEIELQKKIDLSIEKLKRLEELESLINNPEIEDFLKGVRLESAHQTEKWGNENEERKLPHEYALVMDKLKGKQALAIWDRNDEKYKHHLITMAAVCFNAHRQIKKEGTAINNYFTQ